MSTMKYKGVEPETVTAGDTLQWSRKCPAHADGCYSPADGWQLSYVLVNASGIINISAAHATQNSADPDEFDVVVPAAETAQWAPGAYSWQGYVTLNGERHRIAEGRMTVAQNFAALTSGSDQRSHNQKVYDAICAVLENRATSDVVEYLNDTLHVKKDDLAKLEEMKRTYAWRVARETGKAPEYWGAKFAQPFPGAYGSRWPWSR